MRVAAFEFVLAHWPFFASLVAVGVIGAVLITGVKRAAAVREAKEAAAQSQLLDRQMAEIRKGLSEPPSS